MTDGARLCAGITELQKLLSNAQKDLSEVRYSRRTEISKRFDLDGRDSELLRNLEENGSIVILEPKDKPK